MHVEIEGYSSFVNAAIKIAFEAIMAMDMDLQKTLQLFDKDGDGTVDLREAKEVLAQFELGLSSGQINLLLGQLFSVSVEDRDSQSIRMNIQEFLGRFNMVYSANEKEELPLDMFFDIANYLCHKSLHCAHFQEQRKMEC